MLLSTLCWSPNSSEAGRVCLSNMTFPLVRGNSQKQQIARPWTCVPLQELFQAGWTTSVSRSELPTISYQTKSADWLHWKFAWLILVQMAPNGWILPCGAPSFQTLKLTSPNHTVMAPLSPVSGQRSVPHNCSATLQAAWFDHVTLSAGVQLASANTKMRTVSVYWSWFLHLCWCNFQRATFVEMQFVMF